MIHYDSNDDQFTGIDIASYARFLKLSTTSSGYSLRKAIADWANSTLLPLIRSKTPVSNPDDDGVHARDKWRVEVISEGVAGGGGETIRIVNDARGGTRDYAYAQVLEYGSPEGMAPWPRGTADPGYVYEYTTKSGKTKRSKSPSRKTGKTVTATDPDRIGLHETNEKRVWAGGRHPGHIDTIGGPVARALEEIGRKTPKNIAVEETSLTPRGRVLYRSFSHIITAMIEDAFRRVVLKPGQRGVNVAPGFVAPVRGGSAPSIHVGW